MSERLITFMGDTQIGGDKAQTARLKDTKKLGESFVGEADEAWHVGDLGSSSTAYEFLANYKGLEKSEQASEVQLDFKKELDKAFAVIVEGKRVQAGKYIMADVLRRKKGWEEKFPEVVEVLRRFAQDKRVQADEKLKGFVDKNGLADMYKMITGKNVDFVEADEAAMIAEIQDAVGVMVGMVKEGGKVGVVPGNSETANWNRVTEKALPGIQADVDLQREPSYHEINKKAAIMGLPYEFEKGYEFDAKQFAAQAKGKESVILAMHASPLLRGLADNASPEKFKPLSLEDYKAKTMKLWKIDTSMLEQKFEEAYPNFAVRIVDSKKHKGKKVGEVLDEMALEKLTRAVERYGRMKEFMKERERRIEKYGKPDRTPGSQTNPMQRQFMDLVKNLPASVKEVIVPWGHLHSAPEQALANHPWFKFEEGEEIKPQKMLLGFGQRGKREIKFVFLPTAAVAVFKVDEKGKIDVKSLKQVVADKAAPAEK